MRDIPVMLDGYKLTVVEPPMPKTREDGTVITNREGVTQFVVSLFAKLRVAPGQRAPKGEEIKVTLEADPGPGFDEDDRVELVNARLNAYQLDTPDGRTVAGISFKALGLTPIGNGARHAGAGGGEK
jgi:hypothetical protein